MANTVRASDKADANGGNVLTDALSRAIGEDILVIVLVRADTGVCMVKKKEKTSRQPPCVPCSCDAQRMDNDHHCLRGLILGYGRFFFNYVESRQRSLVSPQSLVPIISHVRDSRRGRIDYWSTTNL